MMYNNKLVAAIKSKGKILREFNDTVFVPFSTEYSILIKNLHTVRALVHINIDNTEVIPGGLMIRPNQEIEVERWIKNGNLSEGNRFKFIERTSNIENHRGIGASDGLIRIEFQFEDISLNFGSLYSTPISRDWSQYNTILRGNNWTESASTAIYTTSVNTVNMVQDSGSAIPANDIGITVPGSKSNQQFSTSSWFSTESTKHVIILKLLGETKDNELIRKPITVKHKPKCQTCGKQNKATSKFCSECGTSLEIFA